MDPDGQTILSAANAATEQTGGSSIFLKIVILIVLILLNAFFAMSEIAIITLNDHKLKKQTEEGNKKAIRASKLTADPSRFLATIQIGVKLSGFLASAVAADSFAKMIVNAFSATTISPSLIHSVALILITLILSYFTLVFGELVPKRIAMQYPEKIAFSVSGILLFLSKILRPFVALLAASTNLAVKAFGIDPNQEPEEVTDE